MQNQQESPDALDALAAAPKHHKLLFEKDSVRVVDTCIAPGDVTPLHTHRWPSALYIVSWSDFVRRDGDGVVVLDSRTIPATTSGVALWSPPLAPHTLENVGTTQLHVIAVELKKETHP